uniref:Tc1-like transposase DDE domain-containing protein n=1 Tax=Lepeophtheirus salmonis TaxID=72036 RepID=A0A0K2U9Y2_LEPSM
MAQLQNKKSSRNHGLGLCGVCAPIFVERKEWFNAKDDFKLLAKKVLPWAREKFGNNFVFTQDGALCHRAPKTQTFLRDNFRDFDMWPPSYPDITSLNYSI